MRFCKLGIFLCFISSFARTTDELDVGNPTDKASFGSVYGRGRKRVINLCLYKLQVLICLIFNLENHTFLLFNVFKVDGVRFKIRFQVLSVTMEHGSSMTRHGVDQGGEGKQGVNDY